MVENKSEKTSHNHTVPWRRESVSSDGKERHTEHLCANCNRWLSESTVKMTFTWEGGIQQQPVCHDCQPPKQSGPTMMNLGKRTTGNVKVISFPEGFTSRINQSPFVMREEWHVILLEDEAGNISRLPEICCKQELQVGKWYHMFQTNAVFYPKYQFTYLTEKNDGYKPTLTLERVEPSSPPKGKLPRKETRIVTILEQPTEENWDNYVVRLSDKTTVKVDYSLAQSFFAIGDKAKVEF